MPKFIIVALAVCLLFLQPIYAQKKSDLEKLGIQGKVKKIEYFSLSFDAQNGWSNRKPWILETYNINGNTIERSVFQEGKISSKVVSFYDVKGRNIGNDSFSSSSGKLSDVPSRTELILDNAGNIVQMKVYYNGSKDAEVNYTYKYDERGNEIERNFGKAIGKSVMTFDKNNNQTSTINSNGEGIIYNKSFTDYNEKNQKIKLTIYDHETLRYEIRYKYDERERLSELETQEFNIIPNMRTSHAPEAGKVVYTYDDKRKTSWTTKYSLEDIPKANSTTIFNEQGKEIGLYCESGKLETCKTVFEYEYEAQRNLTKKTCYGRTFTGETLQPRWAEERVISYY